MSFTLNAWQLDRPMTQFVGPVFSHVVRSQPTGPGRAWVYLGPRFFSLRSTVNGSASRDNSTFHSPTLVLSGLGTDVDRDMMILRLAGWKELNLTGSTQYFLFIRLELHIDTDHRNLATL